jgi:hypothetical protein
MAGSALINGRLEAPIFGSPGFLPGAAPHAGMLGVAVMISLLIEGLFLATAIIVYPILAERSKAVAIWLVAFGVVVVAATLIENAEVLAMVNVSRAYIAATAADRDQFTAIRAVVAGARNAAHYLARACDGVFMLALFLALGRFSLVPRVLAGFGVLAAMSMLASVTRPFFGAEVVFPMLAPLGLAELALLIWLLLPRRGHAMLARDVSVEAA